MKMIYEVICWSNGKKIFAYGARPF